MYTAGFFTEAEIDAVRWWCFHRQLPNPVVQRILASYGLNVVSGSTNLGTANFTNNQNMHSDVKLPSFAKAVDKLPLSYFFDYDDVKSVYLMFKGAGQRTLPPRDVVWAILRARLSTTIDYRASHGGKLQAWTRSIYLEKKLRLETTWTEYENEKHSWFYILQLFNRLSEVSYVPFGGTEDGMEMRWSKDGEITETALYGPSFAR